jgi:low temperature requirement protein LtrA
VAFIELFFDLVFVLAITQLSHTLMEHFTPAGAVRTLLLLLAVWWVWIYTSWVTNWLNPEKLPVRLLLLGLTVVGLILSASIPEAFGARGMAFAVSYVIMQVGRTAFTLWVFSASSPGQRRNFTRILVWLVVSGVFWIAGGLAQGTTRLGLWTLALGLDYVSPSLGFRVPGLGRSITSDWNVSGEHMAERCGLFIIIALGESVLVTGATFSGLEWTPATAAAFVAATVGSLALWWLYFDTSARTGSETISTSSDPGRLARLAYTYIHILLVAGIVVSAAADEFVLAHPVGRSSLPALIAVLGGAALFLIGTALFRWAISGTVPASHWVGILGLGTLIPVAGWAPPFALLAMTTLVLVLVAAWDKLMTGGSA